MNTIKYSTELQNKYRSSVGRSPSNSDFNGYLMLLLANGEGQPARDALKEAGHRPAKR